MNSQPKTLWAEKELLPATLQTPITKEELSRIKSAWAKSYKVQESFVKLSFEKLDIEDPSHLTHVKMHIDIRGEILADGTIGNSTEWRRVYSLVIMPPENIQTAAKQRLLQHTPLTPISIIKTARAAPPKKGDRLRIE